MQTEAHQKQIELNVALDAARHHVLGDATRLQQVFWNVLKNAVKFTPARGRVSVRSFNPAPRRIAICVEDTGIGITPEALGRIFRAFGQGETAGRHEFGGLGLGLSISKAIVDLHGGELRAASKGAGRGAAFTVELALTAPPSVDGEHAPPPISVPTPLRLLVVEDHEPTLNAVRLLLEKDGHRVFAAATISDALAHAEANECDLVISDLGLPDGSGFDLMSAIRRRRDWPAIALSGYGMDADVLRSAEAGFATHLVKPVDIGQLRAAIANALRRD